LDFLLEHRLYRPVSPRQIEDLYEKIAPETPDFHFVTASQLVDGSAPPEKIILKANSHVQMAKVLGVPELSGEIERAVWQINRERKKQDEANGKKVGAAGPKS
jgi:hypothetical protein